jgi:hypothetical protein
MFNSDFKPLFLQTKPLFMKFLIALFCLFIHLTTTAQDTTGVLEGNNVKAFISNRGVFFNNKDSINHGYEVPKDGGNHLIYSSAFFFGGIDEDGNKRVAAELLGHADEMGEPLRDLYPGAISADGLAEAPETPFADDVYIVSRAEILYHAVNYNVWDYEMPEAIANWPAHGDITLGLAENLAPFADLNGNGVYEPTLGEYPEIRGDHAAYVILNDTGGPHLNSGGAPMGLEIHFMFYQFEDEAFLNNTTFVNVRVINRSTTNYTQFSVGNLVDFDIGFSDDDLGGYDETLNLIYGFNGDLLDEPHSGRPGYGENPPVVGCLSLNHNATAQYVINKDPELAWVPETDSQFWNYVSGYWDSSEGTGSMADKLYFMATENSDLEAGGVVCYDFAYVTSHAGTPPMENIETLKTTAEDVQNFYNGETNVYCDFTLSTPKEEALFNEQKSFIARVIPSTNHLEVIASGSFDLYLFDLQGKIVHKEENNFNSASVWLDTKGIYLVSIITENGTLTRKVVY